MWLLTILVFDLAAVYPATAPGGSVILNAGLVPNGVFIAVLQ